MGRTLPVLILLAAAGLARPDRLPAQTGDQTRLVFTVSAGYSFGKDLWSVGAQPIILDGFTDLLALDRKLNGTWIAELGATYFRSPALGFTFDLSFIDIATEDSCRMLTSSGSIDTPAVCGSINGATSSALSTAVSAGIILRAASRQKVSPYLRAQGGVMVVSRSTTEMIGNYINADLEPVYVPIYPTEGSSSVSAQFALGAGVTIPISKAYHARVEGRATTFGLQVVDGPTDFQGMVPNTSTRYITQWSILIGFDLVLEKKHGRRY